MTLQPNWAQQILRSIGAPITPSNLHVFDLWQRAEGGGTANDANFNPFNTTQPMPGAGVINSVGVRSYLSGQQGVRATRDTLLNGNYDEIVNGLRRGAAPVQIARAIARSPWGTGEGVLRLLGQTGGGGLAAPTAPRSAGSATAGGRVPSLPSAPPTPQIVMPQIGLSTSALTSNLGRIAQGAEPTDLLADTSNTLLSQLLQPSKLRYSTLSNVQTPSFDLRGHPTTQASRSFDPGGGWGGSYGPATAVAKVGERYGLVPTSQKRDTKMSASGLVSDHWVGSKNAYAYDLGGTVQQMDEAARAITKRLGIPYSGGALVGSVVRNGLRYQILYRTNVGGNHFNHIHIGVKRVG